MIERFHFASLLRTLVGSLWLAALAPMGLAQAAAQKGATSQVAPTAKPAAPAMPVVEGEEIDRVVAIVDGDLILDSDVDEERMLMLPPTYLTCLEVAQYADPAAVLDEARDRSVEMFTPQVEQNDEGGTLSIPPRLEALLESRS